MKDHTSLDPHDSSSVVFSSLNENIQIPQILKISF
jgi:hypothetical protein